MESHDECQGEHIWQEGYGVTPYCRECGVTRTPVIDLGAIREVIADINRTGMPGTEHYADKLSRAIGGV